MVGAVAVGAVALVMAIKTVCVVDVIAVIAVGAVVINMAIKAIWIS